MVGRKSDTTRTYNPTSFELAQFVDKILAENPQATCKEIYEKVCAQNSTWQVSQRRVSKFVKRKTPTHTEDGGDGSSSVASSSSMGSIRRFFHQRSERKAAKQQAAKAATANAISTTAFGSSPNSDGDGDSLSSALSQEYSHKRRLFGRRKEKNSLSKYRQHPTTPTTILVSTPVAGDSIAPPAEEDALDDSSVTSKGSIGNFWKEQRAKRQAKKAKKIMPSVIKENIKVVAAANPAKAANSPTSVQTTKPEVVVVDSNSDKVKTKKPAAEDTSSDNSKLASDDHSMSDVEPLLHPTQTSMDRNCDEEESNLWNDNNTTAALPTATPIHQGDYGDGGGTTTRVTIASEEKKDHDRVELPQQVVHKDALSLGDSNTPPAVSNPATATITIANPLDDISLLQQDTGIYVNDDDNADNSNTKKDGPAVCEGCTIL